MMAVLVAGEKYFTDANIFGSETGRARILSWDSIPCKLPAIVPDP
jgi:hypothetical protein